LKSKCEKPDDPLTGHIEETNRRTDRVIEELNAKTKVLEIDFSRRVANTDSDIQPLDRLCGLVVRVSGYRYRGPGFDSRLYQIF
jgi:hypothetical protein